MIEYGTVILWSWVVFLLVWFASSFTVKQDVPQRQDRSREPLMRAILFVLIVFIAWNAFSSGAGFDEGLFFPSELVGWLGAVLTVAGVLFAIWARVYLGRNWSSHPTHKENHELVVGGPYTWVRHPIYTGILLAGVGSTLTGSVFGALVLILLVAVFVARIPKEESIMRKLFPETYPAYEARTKKLIPFVW